MGKSQIKIVNNNIDKKLVKNTSNRKPIVSFYTLGCRKV